MSEPASALGHAAFPGAIKIEEIGPLGMVILRGDPSEIGGAVSALVGFDVPDRRRANTQAERGLMWMAHDELLLLTDYESASATVSGLTECLSEVHHLAADVSDARAVFRLTGDPGNLRDALAKLTPADLRATHLPPKEVRRTRVAQVPAAFWFDADDVAFLICFRSVASYVFDLLTVAATPGSEPRYF